MKSLYWQTRPLRRTASGGRRAHWPCVVLNLALAFAFVTLVVGGLVLAGLNGDFAELFGLADALLPIIVTWALALAAVGLGYRLTVPVDCLPGEAGETPAQWTTRWFHWANLRAVLFGVLSSITVLLLARTLSDWQGRRAWEAYRAEAEKRGVVFELEKLMPPPVPDAENFAATPLLRKFQPANPEWKAFRYSTNYNERTATPVRPDDLRPKMPAPHAKQWFDGKLTDLAAWQTYYRASTNWPKWPEPREPAADVLKALSRWDSELAELAEAGRRPHCRFNLFVAADGVSTLLPHYAVLKGAAETLRLRAVARNTSGQTAEAFADVNLLFRLSESIATEPLLIGHLVRIALHTHALRTVWEGLEAHRWTDAQLAHWQKELGRRDFGAELRHAMAGEQAFGNRAVAFIRRRPEMLDALGGDANGDPPGIGKQMSFLTPPGWLCVEQVNLNHAFEEFIMGALPKVGERFDPVLIRSKDVAMMAYFAHHSPGIKVALRHTILARMFLPALTGSIPKACRAQTFNQLASAACALERHWLARGSYPESLAAHAPEFGPLPSDPMSGQPFRYERTADGRFRLWSVGWNGKDDGGTVALTGTPASKSRNINFEQGDWVWPVPAK